jgi:magnesium transporter
MVFLTDFLGAQIIDADQRYVGKVRDLIATSEFTYPLVIGLLTDARNKRMISWDLVKSYGFQEVVLSVKKADVKYVPAQENMLWLARDILDKQVVDTNGRRVVRVNDVQLGSVDRRLVVVGVDIGFRGLLRRLGLEKAVKFLASLFRLNFRHRIVAWDVLDPVRSDSPAVKLRVAHNKLAKLHPADIADIVMNLGPKDRAAILSSLDEELAADALEELDSRHQAVILEQMDPRTASQIVEAMGRDEAADLLSELPDEKASELLGLMTSEDASDIKGLMRYPEDTAGGIMTTEFVVVPRSLTGEDCIQHLRKVEPDVESIYYIYVIDEDQKLCGVFSLRDLIMANPHRPIDDIMQKHVVKVTPDASIGEVAALMEKYNLIAIPVVDEANHIIGIVTIDDVMERILPAGLKKRLPGVFR